MNPVRYALHASLHALNPLLIHVIESYTSQRWNRQSGNMLASCCPFLDTILSTRSASSNGDQRNRRTLLLQSLLNQNAENIRSIDGVR